MNVHFHKIDLMLKLIFHCRSDRLEPVKVCDEYCRFTHLRQGIRRFQKCPDKGKMLYDNWSSVFAMSRINYKCETFEDISTNGIEI